MKLVRQVLKAPRQWSFLMLTPVVTKESILVAEILQLVEKKGLRVVELKRIEPTRTELEEFLPWSEEWGRKISRRLLERYQGNEEALVQCFGTTEPLELSKRVRERRILEQLAEGPLIGIILHGENALEMAREIAGDKTCPLQCKKGTLRRDFSPFEYLSYDESLVLGKAVKVVHRPETEEELFRDLIWFDKISTAPPDKDDLAINDVATNGE